MSDRRPSGLAMRVVAVAAGVFIVLATGQCTMNALAAFPGEWLVFVLPAPFALFGLALIVIGAFDRRR